MSQRNMLILVAALVVFGLGAGAGVLGYTWIVGGSGEASEPISAPTLSLEQNTASTPEAGAVSIEQAATSVAQVNTDLSQLAAEDSSLSENATFRLMATEVARLNTQVTGLTGEVAPAPAANTTTEPAADSQAAPAERILFRIVPEESQVRFTLTEELRGVPTTVIGRTNQVAGDIIVDFGTPSNSEAGTIRINARTLLTDNEFRNRAIRSQILESSRDEYEFSEFTPTSLTGLPGTITMGEPVSFQITGDLKVRNITQTVTFDVTVTPVSETEISGSAKTTVTRAQYNLVIPNVPGVANVSDNVTLEIDFVARKVES